MKHIGILAHSADGAALCFLEMVRHAATRLGPHEHPEITLSILPMAPTLPAYERGDLAAVDEHLRRSAARLAAAGCDFFVCPDNTAHIALDAASQPLPLPGLHICEVVAQQARSDGRRCVALLGTRWTMEGPAYRAAFERAGVALRSPGQAERAVIDRVIFEELCRGVVSDASRAEFVRIIAGMQAQDCDAVALSCTEIPLLIPPEVSPLPTLDSTRLLARAAVAVALGDAPTPTWHGGQRPARAWLAEWQGRLPHWGLLRRRRRIRRPARGEERLQDRHGRQAVANPFLLGVGKAGLAEPVFGLEAGEPFVERLDGQAVASELGGELLVQAGLRAGRAVHVERQADDRTAGLVLGGVSGHAAGVAGEVAGTRQDAGR
jgi:aspartate racemase